MPSLALLLAFTLNSFTSPQTSDSIISGRVVDALGKPVAGAEVRADYGKIFIEGTASTPMLITNAEGAFEGALKVSRYPWTLSVVSQDRKLGGVIVLDQKPTTAQSVKLSPVVPISMEIALKDVPTLKTNSYLVVRIGQDAFVASSIPIERKEVVLRLPAGSYDFELTNDGALPLKRSAVLADKPVKMKACTLIPTQITRSMMLGEIPQWNLTGAVGADPKLRIEDLKGKWVIVEFWEYACGLCLEKSLPRLMALDEKYAHKRDKFAILSFHNEWAANLDDVKKHIDPDRAVRRKWSLPILFDKTGETIKNWGVKGYPTMVLINPEGRIVKTGGNINTIDEIPDFLEAELLKD